MSRLCRWGWHRWAVTPGPDHRMATRCCRRCGRSELQMGDGSTWLEIR